MTTTESQVKNPFSVGSEVSLYGFIYIPGGKQIKSIEGTVVRETAKAFCVETISRFGDYNVWVPKSAVYNIEWNEDIKQFDGDLKRWFVAK